MFQWSRVLWLTLWTAFEEQFPHIALADTRLRVHGMLARGKEGQRLHFLWTTSESFTLPQDQILDFLNISNRFVLQW